MPLSKINTNSIADDAVTTAKITDANITTAKMLVDFFIDFKEFNKAISYCDKFIKLNKPLN